MKINIDNQEVLALTEIQKRVIKSYVFEDEFQDDMTRRVKDAIESKYLACHKRLKDEWDAKLEASGVTMIPTNKEEYAKLVFAQPDYKSRSDKESISK